MKRNCVLEIRVFCVSTFVRNSNITLNKCHNNKKKLSSKTKQFLRFHCPLGTYTIFVTTRRVKAMYYHGGCILNTIGIHSESRGRQRTGFRCTYRCTTIMVRREQLFMTMLRKANSIRFTLSFRTSNENHVQRHLGKPEVGRREILYERRVSFVHSLAKPTTPH